MYGNVLLRSWECGTKNWPVAFAPLAYGVALSVVMELFGRLGFVGGILLAVATQACVSSALHLVENMVRVNRANFNDFLKGFTIYLWELLTVAFILWIPMRVAAIALASVPNGGVIYFSIQIALYVLLNPLPEFIYHTRTSGIALLSASYSFIVENWIEWLLPNIVLTAAGYFVLRMLEALVVFLPGFLQFFVLFFGLGLCLTYFMVFRGFLFVELSGTNRRSRIYRYDARSST